MSPATTEVNMEVSQRTKHRSTYEPAVPLLVFTQWSRSQHITKTPTHQQSPQFTTAKCPLTQAWIEKFPQSHRRAKLCCLWRVDAAGDDHMCKVTRITVTVIMFSLLCACMP